MKNDDDGLDGDDERADDDYDADDDKCSSTTWSTCIDLKSLLSVSTFSLAACNHVSLSP